MRTLAEYFRKAKDEPIHSSGTGVFPVRAFGFFIIDKTIIACTEQIGLGTSASAFKGCMGKCVSSAWPLTVCKGRVTSVTCVDPERGWLLLWAGKWSFQFLPSSRRLALSLESLWAFQNNSLRAISLDFTWSLSATQSERTLTWASFLRFS